MVRTLGLGGRGLEVIVFSALLVVQCYGNRGARLVISSRQFRPGVQGVGEVVKVDGEEFERLRVVGGNASDAQDFSTSTTEVVTTTTTTSSTSSSVKSDNVTEEENPVVVAADPQDSSRGGSVQGDRYIDRRKVGVKQDGDTGLSFTGILNGLLDSFINDPPPSNSRPQPPRPPPPPTNPTTQQPSTEDVSIQDDEEDDELELSPEEEAQETGKSSPTKPTPPPQTEEMSNENVSEEPIEDEEESYDNATNSKPQTKACEGECRNIIFGLFLCDEIDNEAFCPESGLACCVNNPEPEFNRYKPYGNGSSEEEINLDNEHDLDKPPAHESEEIIEDLQDDEDEPVKVSEEEVKKPPPQQSPPQQPPHRYNFRPPPYNPQSQPPPPPQYYFPPHQKNPPPMIMRHPPNIPLPCPRYCVKNLHDGYCSERLPNQFSCGMDAFCCSHSVNPIKEEKPLVPEEDEVEDDLFRNEGLEEADQNEENVTKIIGPCTEEVGSCVSKNIINIICFGHAQPTEVYTCPRMTMKCCARKTALPKDSLPSTTQPPIKLPENSITRNSSSQGYPKPIPPPPPGPPAILPQFVPHPPPPQHSYPPANYNPMPTNPPAPPIIAETPPPPPIGIPSPQYTSNVINPIQSRVPPRQPVGQYVCGVKGVPTVSKKRRKKRVVGGSDSLPGEWCWQVALINSLNQYLCGGALIGTQWVLTAAHCVTNIVRSGDAIYVRVGDHDLTSRYGSPGAQTLRVATTYIHHNHNSQTLDNDIALLKLQGNAALKEGVCLVCLPSRNHMSEVPGKRCTVTGYGYMGESGPIPLRIREANLPIVSDDECVRKVNAVTEKVFALPMSSFCAGGDKSGHDACQGDGGGPLVCRADDPTTGDAGVGYYELTGLVSWGFGCGRENVPGVYVKVSSFIGWIHQIIRSN